VSPGNKKREEGKGRLGTKEPTGRALVNQRPARIQTKREEEEKLRDWGRDGCGTNPGKFPGVSPGDIEGSPKKTARKKGPQSAIGGGPSEVPHAEKKTTCTPAGGGHGRPFLKKGEREKTKPNSKTLGKAALPHGERKTGCPRDGDPDRPSLKKRGPFHRQGRTLQSWGVPGGKLHSTTTRG